MLSTDWLGALLVNASKVPRQPFTLYLVCMRRFCVRNKRKRQLVPDMRWVASNRGLPKTMKANRRYLRTKCDSLELKLRGKPIVCRGMCAFELALGARKPRVTFHSWSQPPEKSGAEIRGQNAALELDFWVFHLDTSTTTILFYLKK